MCWMCWMCWMISTVYNLQNHFFPIPPMGLQAYPYAVVCRTDQLGHRGDQRGNARFFLAPYIKNDKELVLLKFGGASVFCVEIKSGWGRLSPLNAQNSALRRVASMGTAGITEECGLPIGK